MSWELVLRHVKAVQASVTQQQVGLELVASQLAGLEAYAKAELAQGRAEVEIAPWCREHRAEDCARLSSDAVLELGGMGGSAVQLMCRGCGFDPNKPAHS